MGKFLIMKGHRRMNVDPITIETLENYVEHGLQPGGFIEAVLENDLYLTLARADVLNKRRLFEIVGLMFRIVPVYARGEIGIVKTHLHRFHNDEEYRNACKEHIAKRRSYQESTQED